MSIQLSVIIPTCNRVEHLKECLKSLFDQTFSRTNFEIVVVDDGSTDNTTSLVRLLQKKYKNLKYFKQENKGPAAARNLGLKHTKGHILVLLDDDCEVDNNWLDNLVKLHRDNNTSIMGGEIVNKGNVFAQTAQIAQTFWLSTIHTSHVKTLKDFLKLIKKFEGSGPRRFVNFLPSNNFSFKRRVLKNVAFDESFYITGEDLDLCQTLKDKGYKLWYDPAIKIKHNPQLNFFSFIKKHFLYGRGFGYFKRKHASYHFNIPNSFSNSIKFFLEPLFIPFILSFSSNQIKYKILCFPLFFLQEIFFRIGFLNGYYDKNFKDSQPVIK
ncbi:MAG: glycosyltransferase [Candidatus Omnitrophota bacterium]|nr:glycosyltransferase [Candidatus Omnitrophota bacterium]